MRSELVVFGLHFSTGGRVRRRWFVVLVYVLLGVADVAWVSAHNRAGLPAGAGLIITGSLALVVMLLEMVLTSVTGYMRAGGDERETNRRQNAFASAYPLLGYFVVAALFAGYFRGPNPITPLLPPSLRDLLVQLPSILLVATAILYVTLPQATLIWTEPDIEDAQQVS